MLSVGYKANDIRGDSLLAYVIALLISSYQSLQYFEDPLPSARSGKRGGCGAGHSVGFDEVGHLVFQFGDIRQDGEGSVFGDVVIVLWEEAVGDHLDP